MGAGRDCYFLGRMRLKCSGLVRGLKSDDLRSSSLASRAHEKLGLRKHCTRIVTHARKSLTT